MTSPRHGTSPVEVVVAALILDGNELIYRLRLIAPRPEIASEAKRSGAAHCSSLSRISASLVPTSGDAPWHLWLLSLLT